MPVCKALQLAQYDTPAAGTIAELRASSAEKSALLAAAEERLARLEALHSIAQACTNLSSHNIHALRTPSTAQSPPSGSRSVGQALRGWRGQPPCSAKASTIFVQRTSVLL